jgi:predicted transcriptional regulator
VDATYTIIKASELSEDIALWQKIAESDVVNDLYAMYEYVNFTCAWNTYSIPNTTDEDGNKVPGYYLYPTDAQYFLTTKGAQFNYGYQDGYFEGIINKIMSVDPTAFQDLVSNVLAAKALAQKGLNELEAGNYTFEEKYVEKFGTTDYVYTLNKGDELAAEMEKLYTAFSDWLGSWEM